MDGHDVVNDTVPHGSDERRERRAGRSHFVSKQSDNCLSNKRPKNNLYNRFVELEPERPGRQAKAKANETRSKHDIKHARQGKPVWAKLSS